VIYFNTPAKQSKLKQQGLLALIGSVNICVLALSLFIAIFPAPPQQSSHSLQQSQQYFTGSIEQKILITQAIKQNPYNMAAWDKLIEIKHAQRNTTSNQIAFRK